jgi:hypothetical protein
LNESVNPITPHANLLPEFPVFKDSSFSPLPRSSSFSWTTTDLPIILISPCRLTKWSLNAAYAKPSSFVFKFPKSPTCLSSSYKPPCYLFLGLKWGPADLQPSDKSPY